MPAGRNASDLSRLVRGGTFTLAGSISGSVLRFLSIVVITRGLDAARAGVLFEGIALFTIASNIAELGADTGLVRAVARDRALGHTHDIRRTAAVALWPVLAIGIVLGAAGFVLAPRLAAVLIHGARRADGVATIRVLSMFLPLAALTTVALSGTRGFGTMRAYVVIQNVAVPALRPLLMAGTLVAGLGMVAVTLAWSLPVAVGFAAALGALFALVGVAERREPRDASSARSLRELASEFWRFSAPRGLSVVFAVALAWLDVLLVGALRTAPEAGVYATVARFISVGEFSLQAASLAIAPQLSALIARDQSGRAQMLFQTATWWLMAPAWPLYVSLALFGPFLLRIFGAQYITGSTALLIMVPAMIFFVGTGNNKIVLLMGGKSSWSLISIASALLINVVLNLILIPRLGINGAAIAFAAAIVVDNAIVTIAVRVFLKMHPFGRGYPIVAIGSIVCYGAVGLVIKLSLGISLASFLLYGVVATELYIALLWRFRTTLKLQILRKAFRVPGGGREGGADRTDSRRTT